LRHEKDFVREKKGKRLQKKTNRSSWATEKKSVQLNADGGKRRAGGKKEAMAGRMGGKDTLSGKLEKEETRCRTETMEERKGTLPDEKELDGKKGGYPGKKKKEAGKKKRRVATGGKETSIRQKNINKVRDSKEGGKKRWT